MKRRDFLWNASALLAGVVLTQAGCGQGADPAGVGGAGFSTAPTSTAPTSASAAPPAPVVISEKAVATDAQGRVLAVASDNRGISVQSAAGTPVWTVDQFGFGAGQINWASDVVLAPDGRAYVVDLGNGCVQVFDPAGKSAFVISAPLLQPTSLVLDSDRGRLYVNDVLGHTVYVFSPDGGLIGQLGSFGLTGSGLNGPQGLALRQDGGLYVVDSGNRRVQIFAADGSWSGSFGQSGAGPGSFTSPLSIAVDPQGTLYVSDTLQGTVQVFSAAGVAQRSFQPTDAGGAAVVPSQLGISSSGGLLIST